jgi:hypothetical protein
MAFGRLTAFAGGRVIGGMGKGVIVERMMVRWKSPKIGDVVRVKNCDMNFFLPEGFRIEPMPSGLVGNQAVTL